MRILAIETSCDDTCLSILEKRGRQIKLLSQTISSQEKLHARYGGVFPRLLNVNIKTELFLFWNEL